MKAPFPWFGGKSRAASAIWGRFGDVDTYNEPFSGSLAVLLARPHEPRVWFSPHCLPPAQPTLFDASVEVTTV